MLKDLIEIRDIAMHEYYLTQSTKQLGLYNKSIKNLKNYLTSQEYFNEVESSNSIFTGEVDPMNFDSQSLTKIKHEFSLDISDVDMHTVDYELDIYGS